MRIALVALLGGWIIGCERISNDLSQDAIAQSFSGDLVFVPFTRHYPSGWPTEIQLNEYLLNNGGNILITEGKSAGVAGTAFSVIALTQELPDSVRSEVLERNGFVINGPASQLPLGSTNYRAAKGSIKANLTVNGSVSGNRTIFRLTIFRPSDTNSR